MTKEEIVEMLMYLAQNDPMVLAKYAEDDDCGESAFSWLVDLYLKK